MNISMTPELERFVQAKVQSGMYLSASEVVRDALRLLAEQDEIRQKRIEALNREIQIGLDQAARGEFVSAEESEEEMEKLYKRLEQRNAEKL